MGRVSLADGTDEDAVVFWDLMLERHYSKLTATMAAEQLLDVDQTNRKVLLQIPHLGIAHFIAPIYHVSRRRCK